MDWKMLAAVAGICCSSPILAAPLWQQAQSGMSKEEVASTFPAAVAPKDIATLGNGARCELAIEHFEVAKNDYKVCFFFRQSGLEQVTLTAAAPSEAQFNTMVDLLRTKYGRELGAGSPACKRGLLETCEADWALETGANISVLYMTVGGKNPVLNVNYQTRLAEEA